MTNQNQRVFISYSHIDTDFVNLFASLLINFDIHIWKDSKDIPIGGEILDSVYYAIKNTSHFCCIISSSSVKSGWVKEELSYAKHRILEGTSLMIVPILIDDVEIPNYIKVYRCAHLENRNLSLENPELTMILQAFGVNLRSLPPIITGQKRRRLLKSCVDLRDRIVTFRQRLGTFQKRYEAYQKAGWVSKYIRVRDSRPSRRSVGSLPRAGSGYRNVLNPAYYEIKRERDRARSAIIDLREISACVPASVNMVKRALEGAGLSMSGLEGRLSSRDTHLWVLFDSALGRVSEMSETISRVSCDEDDESEEDDENGEDDDGSDGVREDGWDQLKGLSWVHEKLPRWIASIPRIESDLESVIGMLDYWGRFDSDK